MLMKKASKFRNMNMRNKLLIVFILIGLVPVLFFAVFFYQQSKRAFEEELGKYTLEISRQVGERLDAFVQEMERVSNIIRFDPDVQTILNDLTDAATPASIFAERNVRSLFENIGNFRDDFKGIFLVTDRGLLVYNATGGVVKLDYHFAEHDWFREVMQQKDFRLNAAHAQTYVSGEQVISFSTRLMDNREFRTKGTLLIDFSPRTILHMSETIQLGDTGHVFMTTESGEPVVPGQPLPDWARDAKLQELLREQQSGYFHFRHNGVQMLAGFYTSSETGWKMVGAVPFTELASGMYGIRNGIIFMAISALVIIIFLSTALSNMITKPLKVLEYQMAEVGKGDFNSSLPVAARDEIGRLTVSFNRMITELNRMNNEVYQAEVREYQHQIMRKNSELKALQAQINPHFLYNTLNTIACIAEVYDREEIAAVSHSLSRMLQYSITGSSTATIEDEAAHLEAYMSIVNVRFPDKFELELEIASELRQLRILKLVFQPIVENSVNHGFADAESGRIRVLAEQDGGDAVFRLEDDGAGIAPDKLEQLRAGFRDAVPGPMRDSDHIGLLNVWHRLSMFYGDRFHMQIWSEPGAGTQVELRIEGGAELVQDDDRGRRVLDAGGA